MTSMKWARPADEGEGVLSDCAGLRNQFRHFRPLKLDLFLGFYVWTPESLGEGCGEAK